jgi:hypothetical protein
MSVEDPGANSSNCGEGYSCVYTNTISWATPTTPLPMEMNPQVVFERMFGDGSTPSSALRAASATRASSIRSTARSRDCAAGQRRTGAARAVHSRRARDRAPPRDRREGLDRRAGGLSVPVGVPQSFDEHIKLHVRPAGAGFQADITRVGTLLFARDLTGRVYPESAPNWASMAARITARTRPHRPILEDQPVPREDAGVLRREAAQHPDGDGTLLDHSLLLYGSNMGNSNQHLHYDVPHVLIGGNNGRLKGDRHLAYPSQEVPTGNLLLSLLDQFDIHLDSFGDSTGRLPENLV